MSKQKQLEKVFGAGSTHWVGDGFPVRNMLPSNGAEISPFLMLDYAGPMEFKPSTKPRGVNEHPHRGFETVTIAYQGAVDHRDSAGNAGTIFPGDVQWMTAASGVVHEEKHEKQFTENGGIFEMIQLWVNLPSAFKMSTPRYQGIVSQQIPRVDLGSGSYARIIAGELHGVAGPAKTFTPVNLFDLRFKGDSRVELTLPEDQKSALFLLKGDVKINSSGLLQGEAQIAVFSATGGTQWSVTISVAFQA